MSIKLPELTYSLITNIDITRDISRDLVIQGSVTLFKSFEKLDFKIKSNNYFSLFISTPLVIKFFSNMNFFSIQ